MAFKENAPIEHVRDEPGRTGRAAAIARLNGNEALYNELLKMFFAEDPLGRLRVFLAEGDVKNALLSAHGIKGTAANLGLEELSAHAGKVERPLRENDVTAAWEAFSKLEREYGTLSFF
ncbi:MAG TPA: Hpt domain-containing protein [Clostridia bacterium]|nr:Hpt domain-containing protein [Clostridia bacterium]